MQIVTLGKHRNISEFFRFTEGVLGLFSCFLIIADWVTEKFGVAFVSIFLEPWNDQGFANDKINCLARFSRNTNPFMKYLG
ncbi:hypothetical protein [Neptuniibacter sp.]|uniref:hypothetical protein n=1 Tax=Neptuniibacter sp. TaxID=1962643 RepID=UPI0026028452|nr:hypothetical protein [Neptuniibacter sp.]MCP4595211.1 hypothetical protein [Neptuniibacter sp.]